MGSGMGWVIEPEFYNDRVPAFEPSVLQSFTGPMRVWGFRLGWVPRGKARVQWK
jgi:hypothetical protein